MKGIIEEGKEVLEEAADADMRDSALIASSQRVEHHEIAAYGTVRAFAEELGFDQQVQLLQKTLDEEGETDDLLTGIAEGNVNRRADE